MNENAFLGTKCTNQNPKEALGYRTKINKNNKFLKMYKLKKALFINITKAKIKIIVEEG